MVRGPMMAELTAGCSSTKAVAPGDPLGPATGVVLAGTETTRQPAPGQRAPREDPHPEGLGRRQDVPLDAPDEDGVRGLLGHEALASPSLGHPLGLHDLLGREGGTAEGADLAGMDQIAEGPEGLVHVDRLVGPVDLVQVDVVDAQAPQALLALGDDPPPRVPLGVGVVAHRRVHLGGQHHTRPVHLGQRLPHDHLRLAGRVDVGRVDEVDAAVEGLMDLDSGSSEGAVVHPLTLGPMATGSGATGGGVGCALARHSQ